MNLGEVRIFTETEEDKPITFIVTSNEDIVDYVAKDVASLVSADFINSFNGVGEETELSQFSDSANPFDLSIAELNETKTITLTGSYQDLGQCDNNYRVRITLEIELEEEEIVEVQ